MWRIERNFVYSLGNSALSSTFPKVFCYQFCSSVITTVNQEILPTHILGQSLTMTHSGMVSIVKESAAVVPSLPHGSVYSYMMTWISISDADTIHEALIHRGVKLKKRIWTSNLIANNSSTHHAILSINSIKGC